MESNLEPTIITLGSGGNVAVSFEDAFGEFSNAAGKFRAKRAEKKAANQQRIQAAKQQTIQAKAQTKAVKQEAKAQKKVGKQAVKNQKIQAKQQNKLQKKVGRVDIRQQAQQARLNKRAGALEAKQQIQQMRRQTPELPPEEEYVEDSVEETEIEQPVDSAEIDSPEYYEEEGGEEYEQNTSEGEEPIYEDDGYTDDIADYESGLFMADGSSVSVEPYPVFEYENADGETVKAPIRKEVQEMANKIEWNREKVCRLVEQLNATEAEAFRKELEDKIEHHKGRVIELVSKLDGFASFDGADESSADGKRKIARRRAETGAAMREAKKSRIKGRRASMKSKQNQGKNFVKVEMGLNPKIVDKKLVIPSQETSSFDGKAFVSKINVPYAIAGVALAALTIYGIKKFKLV